jgi:hypothetical protein
MKPANMPPAPGNPPRDPSKPKLLHQLITSPPRASYLDQKAHIYAVEIPEPGPSHVNTANLSVKERSNDSPRECSSSAPAQHVVGTGTDVPIARKFATTSMRKRLDEGTEEYGAHLAIGAGVQQVRPVDKEP